MRRRVIVNGRHIDLELSKSVLEWFIEWKTKRLVLYWARSTQFPNIIWERFVTVGLSQWPWVRSVETLSIDEKEGGMGLSSYRKR